MITESERLAISALGPEVVRLAECPERARPRHFWRDLLVTLYRTNPDVMETQAGLRFAHAVVCRMEREALTDGYLPTGKVGNRNLAAGWYSFAEALTVVAEHLVGQGRDRAVLKGLRASGMTVREYLRTEFDIIAGPREGYTRTSPDRADMKSFHFALDTARWVARRRVAEERRQRKSRAAQAWSAGTPGCVM
jgi:hypothetical protein